MGVGDELIAAGQAKRLQAKNPAPVLIVDASRRPRWNPVWDNNPRLIKRSEGKFQYLVNAPGVRPYVHAKTAHRWAWRKFDLVPGEMYFTEDEQSSRVAGLLVIEPNIKGTNDGNKGWIWERWQAVADAFPGRCIQFMPSSDTRVLRNVWTLKTPTFREAAAVLANAAAFVGTEGALHHAAAALGRPAVVLFSEFISPAITGYKTHRNLYHAGAPCGMRSACPTCRASMEAITVDEVVSNLREIL